MRGGCDVQCVYVTVILLPVMNLYLYKVKQNCLKKPQFSFVCNIIIEYNF